MPQQATTSLKNWNFQENHVQQNLVGGDFIGSHSCILCATGPRMKDMVNGGQAFTNDVSNTGTEDLDTQFAIPIGVVDSATLQQDRQIAQIFEIGSKRSYILAARTVGAMSIARVFYKGANLLRMLYAYYPASKLAHKIGTPDELTLRDVFGNPATGLGPEPIAVDPTVLKDVPPIKDLPGYANVIMNLNSDLFSQPFGIVMYMKDNADRDVAAVFLEECYIQNHAMSLSANSIIVAENVSLRFERVVPIKVRVVTLGDRTGASKTGLNAAMGGAFAAAGLPGVNLG